MTARRPVGTSPGVLPPVDPAEPEPTAPEPVYVRERGRPFLQRLVAGLWGKDKAPIEVEIRRLEEKRIGLKKATDQWLSLLREMEQQGQSTDAAYDRYYRAYQGAKRQQKQVELKLFNARQMRGQ